MAGISTNMGIKIQPLPVPWAVGFYAALKIVGDASGGTIQANLCLPLLPGFNAEYVELQHWCCQSNNAATDKWAFMLSSSTFEDMEAPAIGGGAQILDGGLLNASDGLGYFQPSDSKVMTQRPLWLGRCLAIGPTFIQAQFTINPNTNTSNYFFQLWGKIYSIIPPQRVWVY